MPVQPPFAVQEVAFVLDQVNIELLPDAMIVGLADNVTVGAEEAVTDTVTLAGADVPPAPTQVNV